MNLIHCFALLQHSLLLEARSAKLIMQIIKRSLVIIWRSAQHFVNTLCVFFNLTARAQRALYLLEVKAKAMLEITVRSKRKLTNLLVYTRWWSISYFMHGFSRKPFRLLWPNFWHHQKQRLNFTHHPTILREVHFKYQSKEKYETFFVTFRRERV